MFRYIVLKQITKNTSSHGTDLTLLLEIMYCGRNLEIYLLADNQLICGLR